MSDLGIEPEIEHYLHGLGTFSGGLHRTQLAKTFLI
jgi:hypothetical protein